MLIPRLTLRVAFAALPHLISGAGAIVAVLASWAACRTTAPLLLGFLLDAGQWQLWTFLAPMVLTGAAVLLYAERMLPAHVVRIPEATTSEAGNFPSWTMSSRRRTTPP